MSKFEVISGVEGCCLALDDARIAGPKPWGGGTVIHVWETGETYKATDAHSRWHELFGTPEMAARTLIDICDNCGQNECSGCQVYELTSGGDFGYDTLLGWLRGDAE